MKARVSVLSKNQQKKALAEIDKMTDKVIEKKMAQVTRRLLKLVCHVLNEHFQFGKHRLSLVIKRLVSYQQNMMMTNYFMNISIGL